MVSLQMAVAEKALAAAAPEKIGCVEERMAVWRMEERPAGRAARMQRAMEAMAGIAVWVKESKRKRRGTQRTDLGYRRRRLSPKALV